MSTIIKSGIKKIDYNGIIPTGRDIRYYQSELTVTGIKPNREFSIKLYSSESNDMGVAVEIGTIDPKTGALTLIPEPADPPSDDERLYKFTLQRRTTQPGTYWQAKISDEPTLRPLADKEKVKLGIATGNVNEDETGGGDGGGNNNNNNNNNDSSNPGTCPPGQHMENGRCVDDDSFNPAPYFNDPNTGLTDIEIEGRSFRKKYPKDLHYPEGLGSNRQDRIRFTQKYTQGRKVNVSLDSNVKIFQRDPEIKLQGSVTLPIVTGIGDRNSVDWKDESLNPIQALAAGAAVNVFEDIRKHGLTAATAKNAAGMVDNVRDSVASDKDIGGNMAKAINIYLAQQAVGAQGLLSRATGAILNPNLEMLFGGPKLRSFGFTFKLSPRDASEANHVRKILRFFKQGMSIKTSASNVFLQAPNVFDIQYQTFNTDGNLIAHPSINFIKTCALTSCDVQYTPEGTYMTYEDPYRTMQSYQLTLNFGELDPIFDDDYTDLDNNNDIVIGY